jgi:hypothetical protein
MLSTGAATESVSLCGADEKLTVFLELESAIRDQLLKSRGT